MWQSGGEWYLHSLQAFFLGDTGIRVQQLLQYHSNHSGGVRAKYRKNILTIDLPQLGQVMMNLYPFQKVISAFFAKIKTNREMRVIVYIL